MHSGDLLLKQIKVDPKNSVLALYIYKRKGTSALHSKLIVRGGKQVTMFPVVYVLFSNETIYVEFTSIHCPC